MVKDLDVNENTILWPESEDSPPDGWHWGRHVSLGPIGGGYYLVRDIDDAVLIAVQRPDLNDIPTEIELQAALDHTQEWEWE